MNNTSIRTGVIGAGLMGKRHANEVASKPEFELVAIADLNLEAATELADCYGAHAYRDCTEMFGHHELDLAIIATPEWAHYQPFMCCLENGVRNLIIEKPLACTVDEAQAMYDKAEETGALVFVNFSNRFDPRDMATYWVINNNWIGEVNYIEMHLDDNIVVPKQLWGNRSSEWAAKSSPVHFLMSHMIDLSLWYAGTRKINKIQSIVQSKILNPHIDRAHALLTLSGNKVISLKSEWTKHMEKIVDFEIYVAGTEGSVMYHKLPGYGIEQGWRVQISDRIDDDEVNKGVQVLSSLGVPVHVSTAVINDVSRRHVRSLEIRQCNHVAGLHYLLDGVVENIDTPERWKMFGSLPTIKDGLIAAQVAEEIVKAGA